MIVTVRDAMSAEFDPEAMCIVADGMRLVPLAAKARFVKGVDVDSYPCTTDPAAQNPDIYKESETSYLVDGSATVRELNRAMHLKFPTDGPKTLNGLILEFLETIPQPGTAFKLAGHSLEIVQTTGNAVKTVRLVLPAAPPADTSAKQSKKKKKKAGKEKSA